MRADSLYIVGNGFDQKHNIRSGYDHFCAWLKSSNGDLYRKLHLTYNITGPKWWNGFESNLAEIPLKAVLHRSYEECFLLETIDVASKEKDVVNTVMPEIGYDISRLMLDIQCSIWEFIHGLDVHSAIPIVLFPDDNPVYLNFNYTATLETVYAIDPSKVFHIHGDVRNVENDLVFGHGKNYDELVSKFSMESDDISSDLYDDPGEMKDLISDASRQLASARKCTEDIIRKNHNLFANLSSVQTVCSIGFSFSDVDLPYIDLIAEKVSPNALWKFGWHTDSDMHTMKALVRDRGLRRVEYFYF